MNYRVKIKIPNKIFTIRNRPVRSPVECTVNENEIKLLQSRINYYGLISQKDYSIEEIKLENNNIENKKKDYAELETKKEVQVPTKEKIVKPPDIIPKFQDKKPVLTKPIIPIKKTFKEEHKDFHQKIVFECPKVESIPASPQDPVQKIITDVKPEPEQIIKKDTSTTKTEVKIEELSSRATSILDKFLYSEF